jgi:very-short-patch-repair endonuclease
MALGSLRVYNRGTIKYVCLNQAIGMAESRVKRKEPIMGSLNSPYRETGMRAFGLYLWWAFCMYKKPTKEALDLKHALEKLGIRVLAEVDDGHKHIDLTIPSARINIEVDGCQHFTDPYQILSDLKRNHYSDNLGYDTIHIPNKLIHENLGGIASALAEASKIREER